MIKVFSATMMKDREALGDRVTDWLGSRSDLVVDEIRSMQSSDDEFHCVTLIVFGHEDV